ASNDAFPGTRRHGSSAVFRAEIGGTMSNRASSLDTGPGALSRPLVLDVPRNDQMGDPAPCSSPASIASLALLLSLGLGRSVPAQDRPSVGRARDAGASVSLVLSSFVFANDGTPAEGAVVVSSAGGKAIADRTGSYRFEVEVPREAESVEVIAVGSG